MYKINKGLTEWHIDNNSFINELINKCEIFNIYHKDVNFYSQQDEDKYIIQYLLKEKISDGTFLEVGGCDGILYSNTKTLEDHFNFKGILIEPQKDYYDKLVINRPKCFCYNYAISTKNDIEVDFIGNNPMGGIITTMTDTDLNKFTKNSIYKVKNNSMQNIIKDSSLNYIDFMFIDVEGGELEVLKSIDFNFPIFCIIIEAASNQQEKNKIFGNYLKSKNFTFKERQRGNEIWLNLNYFRKHLFNY